MNSHTLAKLLLKLPDFPVATQANSATYMSGINTHGNLKVGLLHTYFGNHIIIGNISKLKLNAPNWYVTELYY
jgi:hypothetical protein